MPDVVSMMRIPLFPLSPLFLLEDYAALPPTVFAYLGISLLLVFSAREDVTSFLPVAAFFSPLLEVVNRFPPLSDCARVQKNMSFEWPGQS